jgi:hypothetical protein
MPEEEVKTNNRKWNTKNTNWSFQLFPKGNGADELLTVLVLGALGIVALALLKVGGKEIALTVAGGLIGFLKGNSSASGGGGEE